MDSKIWIIIIVVASLGSGMLIGSCKSKKEIKQLRKQHMVKIDSLRSVNDVLMAELDKNLKQYQYWKSKAQHIKLQEQNIKNRDIEIALKDWQSRWGGNLGTIKK